MEVAETCSGMETFATHSCHLLQQLHSQRIQGLLCDCMLVVKGVSFKAHKNVLAAFSQYFRTLFQSSPTQKNDVFHLDIKNVGGIGQILDYMYTSHLDLSRDNVQTLLGIAQSLQVQNVLNLCHSFLKASRSAEQPASLSCNDTYALQNTLAENTSGETFEANLFHVGSSAVQPCKALEDHLPGPQLQALRSLSADTGKEKRDSVEDGGADDLPLKQPSSHYKLRNCSSKQFGKQAPPPSNKGSPELPFDFVVQNTVKNALCDVGRSECALEASGRLPPPFLGQPLNECPQGQDSEGTSLQQPAKQVWLKKAINLHKLNFLQSQKSPEQPSIPQEANGGVARGTDSERQSNAVASEGRPDSQTASSEGLGPDMDPGSPQESSEPGSQMQLFLAERQYPCASCGKAFKHPSNLELHIRSHTGEKPFECNICGKCFSQAGNLQTHLRRHSGEKPYICEICGKRFAASGDVQRHIIIHTGEKPHLCDICGRGFSNFSNLKEHKKNHTVEKVFTCDECGKSFNLPRKLVKHRIRHSGQRPYNCSACGKSFAGSGDLRRHIRTHTGEKPYNCETCNKCFSRSAVLRRHRKTHCKVNCEHANMADEFTHSMEIHDLEKSQSSDFFNQEISVTFLPTSVKFPDHPAEHSPGEFDRPGVTLFRARPAGRKNHHKLSSDPVKLSKPQQRLNPSCSFKEINSPPEEDPLQSNHVPLPRCSMSPMGNIWNGDLGSRGASAECRNSGGPSFSSGALWGLAMKTLQNENELGQ